MSAVGRGSWEGRRVDAWDQRRPARPDLCVVVVLASMTGSTESELRRYSTFIIVLAFHAALVVGLIRFSRTLSLSTPTPLELILIPTAATLRTRPPPVPPNSFHVDAKIAPTAPSAVTIPQPAAPAERAESPIDWAGEAQRGAAAAVTPSPDVRSFEHRFPSESERPPKSIFDEPPEHRAGEQFRTDDGMWVVYVNDDCYQISDPFAAPNALANGMGVQTYCKGNSKTPRGDLFDQLPAYRKNRANP